MMVDSDSGKSAVCILLKQQILYRKKLHTVYLKLSHRSKTAKNKLSYEL